MSGGSQHNPNGRQSQLGPSWSPLQMANLLARAPQAHMASDRGVTWHTPTPPPHLYHVQAPSPPDPLQAMKSAAGNSVFRHTATPPELYRHTPTPPDKHLLRSFKQMKNMYEKALSDPSGLRRHTPSPGDVKGGAPLLPVDLYQHMGPARDKLVRAEELLAYARVGVDLSLSSARSSNGSAASPAPAPPTPPAPPAHPDQPAAHAPPALPAPAAPPAAAPTPPAAPAAPALSVRDAPTINSLIARAQPRLPHARVDALLERLVPSPVSPHSVIMHSRAAPTPSPPSSNEDSADSCGAPPGSKRKRKPERTVRVPSAPPPPAPCEPPRDPPAANPVPARVSPPQRDPPLENGDAEHLKNGPEDKPPITQAPERPHVRRKTRSGSAETIDDIAAMIASTGDPTPPTSDPPPISEQPEPAATVTVDKLKSVLASPEPEQPAESEVEAPVRTEEKEQTPAPVVATPAAPRRRSVRTSNSEAPNVPVESPSEAKPAEPETSDSRTAEPTAASFVEVENQLEKMFAALEEEKPSVNSDTQEASVQPSSSTANPRKRRKSAPARGERRRMREEGPRRKTPRKKSDVGRVRKSKEAPIKDAYDSGSNASSSRSRGPYIQIRGPCDSPVSVSVMNASTGEDEDSGSRRKGEEFRNGARASRGLHASARGLHASTLGLRYDATTPDLTWLCAFCQRGPHAASLGDLFGPYELEEDCDEYRALDENTRRRFSATGTAIWFHEACGVWAPGLVAAGARLWGLAASVWGARGARCVQCGRAGAALACAHRACPARAHLPCATDAQWALDEREFRALCPRHA
ncbi:uncharacterized protein CG5098 isoform X2 [Manduca sexta]|uniref:uncharacterized protein CG5098 isoform X2 n=1 Tax=Manduca sexta TaxID=7130 RepID=UPI0018905177|nr:uncharacterized protein CG5098 isoform X2 [Manduca sexta]